MRIPDKIFPCGRIDRVLPAGAGAQRHTGRVTRRGRAQRTPRRGLVLGGGGVLGAAWTIGAMSALEEARGLDLRSVDKIQGTSAGAVLAALLGGGVPVRELFGHQHGGRFGDGPLAGHEWDYDTATGPSLPGRPAARLGGGAMLVRNVRRIRRMPPATVLAGLAPEGRGSLAAVGRLVEAVTAPDGWSPHPGVAVVTLDYTSGRRVPIGRPGSPQLPLPQAVMASCAIPGWFAPVDFDGHRYVDGGVCSVTSADLMAGLDLDEVLIVAPMIAFGTDAPRSAIGKLERRWRFASTRRLLRETDKLRAEGVRVTILGPGPDDLRAFGTNAMEFGRRLEVLQTALATQRAALQRNHTQVGAG